MQRAVKGEGNGRGKWEGVHQLRHENKSGQGRQREVGRQKDVTAAIEGNIVLTCLLSLDLCCVAISFLPRKSAQYRNFEVCFKSRI